LSCAEFARCTFGSVCRATQPRGSRLSYRSPPDFATVVQT
jgi:hypothetical protein